METELTSAHRRKIKKSIRRKYAKAAASPEGLFKYPTGQAGLEGLGYDPEMIQALSDTAKISYCGVGNPFTLGPIHEGETVLDIGCGGGVDTFVAAMLVGPTGRVVGIDMTAKMLDRARKNLREQRLNNVNFQEGSAEDLPFPEESFDVVISNGVFNLIPDKGSALAEVFRILKPQGRLMLADQILTGQLPKETKARIKSWFR